MAIMISLLFSKMIFSSYQTEKVMESFGNVYYLQYASFTSKEVMNDNIKKLDNYLLYEIDNKYYVYLGIYRNLDIARKMNILFENNGLYTYIKNDYISDSSIIDVINDCDEEILEEDNTNEIFEINKKCIELIKRRVS